MSSRAAQLRKPYMGLWLRKPHIYFHQGRGLWTMRSADYCLASEKTAAMVLNHHAWQMVMKLNKGRGL